MIIRIIMVKDPWLRELKKQMGFTYSVLKESIRRFGRDKVFKLSASLAYYTVFSLAPMLIVIISICGFFFGEEAVRGEVYFMINKIVGDSAATYIQEILKNVSLDDNNRIATYLGLITLIIGATGIFIEIQDSLNYIWSIKAKPKRGWVKQFVNRGLSFLMILIMGLMLVITLLTDSIIQELSNRLIEYFPKITLISFRILNFLITFFIILFLFAIIFKALPDARSKWKDIWVGSATTALLFIIGKLGINYYLNVNDLGSTYGAAGSLIIILVWVYYSSTILYFGAEFTQVYAKFSGRQIQPADYAVFIEKREIERAF